MNGEKGDTRLNGEKGKKEIMYPTEKKETKKKELMVVWMMKKTGERENKDWNM